MYYLNIALCVRVCVRVCVDDAVVVMAEGMGSSLLLVTMGTVGWCKGQSWPWRHFIALLSHTNTHLHSVYVSQPKVRTAN